MVMPQASDDLRDIARLLFGSMVDSDACKFLVSRGYKLRTDYRWDPPANQQYMGEKEEMALRFLIEEWDYGDVVYPPKLEEAK